MKSSPDPQVISTLQMEYNAIRQEIRDLINSMDTNLNLGISMISGAVALAGFIKEASILYMIPSIIFIASCVHLVKTASANVHGAYCQAIEVRLKSLLGSDLVLLNWEGGQVSRYISGATGIVQVGLYILFAVVTLMFITGAILAYGWHRWTACIHISEFVGLVSYAFFATRWNSPQRRAEIVRQFQ